jgi:adenosyl cobinamide kinase/adenosyl cobinamide phosphate guanylyltransferase
VITLVLGGARSGKSSVAEGLAAAHRPPVTYVATMDPAGDAELGARVAAHRLRRDPQWVTVEAGPDLAGLMRTLHGTVLVDSLGPWVAAHLGDETAGDATTGDVTAPGASLCAALLEREDDTVLVSDEVGLAVHPSTADGRRFRDALGALNHAVSAVADRAFFVVAGRAMTLPAAGAPAP